jgi:hypothetical protein
LAEAKAEIDARMLMEQMPSWPLRQRVTLMLNELLKAGAKVNEQNPMVTLLSCLPAGKNQVETLWERYSQSY